MHSISVFFVDLGSMGFFTMGGLKVKWFKSDLNTISMTKQELPEEKDDPPTSKLRMGAG